MTTTRIGRWGTASAMFAAGAVAATAIGGLAVAGAQTTEPSPQPSATSEAGDDTTRDGQRGGEGMRGWGEGPGPDGHHGGRPGGGPIGHLMGGALLHGDAVVVQPDGGYVTLVMQTGAVVTASDTSITVRSDDGHEATYAITDDTTVHRDREDISGSALAAGDEVRVLAEDSGTALTARHIGAMSDAGAWGGPRNTDTDTGGQATQSS